MSEMWKSQQVHEDARKMYRAEILGKALGRWRKQHVGGHDMVRRMDRQAEVLIWCRNARVTHDRKWDQN